MKKLYFSAVLFIWCFSGFGQILNIPDVNFKNALLSANTTNYIASTEPIGFLNSVKIDTNDDGEIQVSEASVITQLSVYNQNISSLEGIAGFSNLLSLSCSYNTITSLNLSGLSHLNMLHCEYNGMTSLTIPPNMRYIYCNNNALTSLDLSTILPVCTLTCDHNALQEIVFPNYDYLITMDCSYNQLNSIDLSHLHDVGELRLNHNNLTSIVFNNPNHTYISDFSFDCSDNPLVHLDMSQLKTDPQTAMSENLRINNTLLTEITIPTTLFKYFYINDNPNLEFLNVKAKNNFYGYDDCFDCGITIHNNPQLQVVCVNDQIPYTFLQSHLNNPNIVYTSYCSFTPGVDYNTVSGTIKFDDDSNSCDASDLPAISIPLKITQGSTLLGSSNTSTDGNYAAYTTSGNIKLTPQFSNPYYTVTPASYTSSFTGFGNTQTVDFCITPNGIHNDLEITLIALTAARPGFNSDYKIIYKNNGTVTQDGTIAVVFNDDIMDFVSTSFPNAPATPNQLHWNFANLQPFESREFTFTMNINSPVETPAVNNGNHLYFGGAISTVVADENTADNYSPLTQTVVGSYDPNDKQVSEDQQGIANNNAEYSHYTIRFQNTGTFAAENVVVSDQLAAKLDMGSIEVISASHPFRSRLTGNKLEFIFENINLPASIDDEPASHGYVTFKIKPLAGVQEGEVIENKANIYFDFNPAIVTNTTATFYYNILGTESFNIQNVFRLYPNPVKNILNIETVGNVELTSIAIYNTLGQLLQTVAKPNSGSTSIDVSALKTGTYFLEIQSDKGKTTKKFVKL